MKRYKIQIIAIGSSVLFTVFTIILLTLAVEAGRETGFVQGFEAGFEAGQEESFSPSESLD